ncbi:MAG: DUF2341 domain-containing protein [Candidatus Parvarchaeota archaeon]|nr:DUF2341 domain-containing protein [Candidatus Parvarchaeota archaeon]
MSPPRRSQSALEYMMTYGWAILVIVIVAAVLYSLGIFSPSSSLSTTVTGFANTPVSSAAFTNNGGLAFSVGDLVGYPIEITNVTEITASGSKITILPNITVSPSQTKVIIIPKAFSSSTQGSHESVSLTITYTEPGQVFQGPYTSTGTVSGTTPTLFFPTNQTFAAVSKLTITNSQTTATPSPFQQMINITSTSPGWTYISQDFGQNVEFFYPNGTIIPSWLENYTSSHALWWVKVGSIPASSSITIYMGFASTSTNLFNTVNDGEAPQLSSTYAEYDDGANVFNYYTNFAGTTLPSGWASGVPSGSSVTANNGLTISGNGANTGASYAATTNAVFDNNNILEGYINQNDGVTDNERGMISISTVNNDEPLWDNGGVSGDTIAGWSAGRNSIGNIIQSMTVLNGAYTYLNSISSNSNWNIYGVSLSSNAGITTSVNYGDLSSTTSDNPSASLYVNLGVYNTGGGSPFNLEYTWVRVRAYPPNGVMPSVSFGSVS